MGRVGYSEQRPKRVSHKEKAKYVCQVVGKSLCVCRATGSTVLLGFKKKKKMIWSQGRMSGYRVVENKMERWARAHKGL